MQKIFNRSPFHFTYHPAFKVSDCTIKRLNVINTFYDSIFFIN